MSLQLGTSASVGASQATGVNTKIRPSHCHHLLHVWWTNTILYSYSLCNGDVAPVQRPHRQERQLQVLVTLMCTHGFCLARLLLHWDPKRNGLVGFYRQMLLPKTGRINLRIRGPADMACDSCDWLWSRTLHGQSASLAVSSGNDAAVLMSVDLQAVILYMLDRSTDQYLSTIICCLFLDLSATVAAFRLNICCS